MAMPSGPSLTISAAYRSEEAYFDEAGKPTLSKEGYAKVIKQYDGVGHQVGEAYFDEAGKPTLSKEGYAKIDHDV